METLQEKQIVLLTINIMIRFALIFNFLIFFLLRIILNFPTLFKILTRMVLQFNIVAKFYCNCFKIFTKFLKKILSKISNYSMCNM